MNEKGSSLLLVLLITIIFSILGLTIIGAAVNNAKRTEIRELEVETTLNSKQLMSVILAQLQSGLNDSTINSILKDNDEPTTSYDTRINVITGGIDCEANRNLLNDLSFDCSSADRPIKIEPLTDLEYTNYIDVSNISEITDFKTNNFTRIYKITISYSNSEATGPTITRALTQNIILSPTPSFLNYAIGAYGKTESGADITGNALVINGSPDIIGDVFAPTLELNSRANFINPDNLEAEDKSLAFYGPAIYGTLFTTKLINNRETTESSALLKAPFFEGTYEEKNTDDFTGIPGLKPIDQNFVDIDFSETFELKRQEALETVDESIDEISDDDIINVCKDDPLFNELLKTNGLVENNPTSTSGINFEIIANADKEITDTLTDPTKNDEYYERIRNPKFKCNEKFFLIEESMLDTYDGYEDNLFEDVRDTVSTIYFTNIDNNSAGQPILKSDNKFTIDKDLILKSGNDKGWLFVNGNLEINGSDDPSHPLTIKGNIIVNGDLAIKSNNPSGNEQYLQFDATVYVIGESTIENVNISGAKDNNGDPDEKRKQLVLLSNGNLKIVRINDFENVSSEKKLVKRINEPPNLKAFFYTNKDATLYGVGSLFEIEGGVFARQKLTINAIRWDYDSSKDIDDALAASSNPNPENEKNSRFYVEYDKDVITDQLSSLPRVNRLQVIPDHLFIN